MRGRYVRPRVQCLLATGSAPPAPYTVKQDYSLRSLGTEYTGSDYVLLHMESALWFSIVSCGSPSYLQ